MNTPNKYAGHHTEDFLTKFWISLVFTIPILLYSEVITHLTGFDMPVFPGGHYLPLILGTFIFFYGGMVFVRGAVQELKYKQPGMMTLISLAIVAAYTYSVWSTLSGTGMDLFWELATLIVIMLLGHWIEMKSVQNAKGALNELAKLLPDSAEVIRDGILSTLPLHELKEGDLALVRPGSKVPADGIVVHGNSEVNESMITGESRPIATSEGMKVIAGSINGDGSLEVRIEKTGNNTFLAGIMRLVSEAEESKSHLQVLSDRAAFYLTIVAVTAGAMTFVSWIYMGESTAFAMERLVAVLVIACPHALGLAIPLVASISTTLAAKNGFFVKQRLALEAARDITTVLFDKTGTLTKGSFGVISVIGNEQETLLLASSANTSSEHPIARAIVAYAENKKVQALPVSSFTRLPGKGVSATVDGATVLVGNPVLLDGLTIDSSLMTIIHQHEKEGKTVIHVLKEGEYRGSIALADVIRDESKEAVQSLKSQGIHVAMITGDAEDVAVWVSHELGIDEHFSHVLPGDKASIVKQLQSRGERVAMVGDGINDAPALAQADLGIAIGAGTSVAIESAGIILVRNDPRDIQKIIALSCRTYSKMIQNLFWATGYNILALPVAAGALYAYGIMLEPAFAAVLMSLSTVIVAINASLLKRYKL